MRDMRVIFDLGRLTAPGLVPLPVGTGLAVVAVTGVSWPR